MTVCLYTIEFGNKNQIPETIAAHYVGTASNASKYRRRCSSIQYVAVGIGTPVAGACGMQSKLHTSHRDFTIDKPTICNKYETIDRLHSFIHSFTHSSRSIRYSNIVSIRSYIPLTSRLLQVTHFDQSVSFNSQCTGFKK